VKDPWFFHSNPELLLADETFVRQTSRQWKQYLSADRNTMKCHPKLPAKLVKYEELHTNLQEQAEALVSFIGADPSLLPAIPKYLMPGHNKESLTASIAKESLATGRTISTKTLPRGSMMRRVTSCCVRTIFRH
jgi:hypothetical protein